MAKDYYYFKKTIGYFEEIKQGEGINESDGK